MWGMELGAVLEAMAAARWAGDAGSSTGSRQGGVGPIAPQYTRDLRRGAAGRPRGALNLRPKKPKRACRTLNLLKQAAPRSDRSNQLIYQ